MRKSRLSEIDIVYAIKQVEVGFASPDLSGRALSA